MNIQTTINQQSRGENVQPHTLLVELLRENLDLIGSKVGCESGTCGSCHVLLDGVSVKSCMVLAVQADGSTITTVEGIGANGEMTDLQKNFQSEFAVQCGFCTPGMVVSATDLLENNASPTDDEIRQWLDGTLCRCTGYQSIVQAVRKTIEQRGNSVEQEQPDAERVPALS